LGILRKKAARSVPDSRLSIDPEALGMTEFPREFFLQYTVAVARSILGSWLVRNFRGRWYGARIVETEAYLGTADAAAHSWRGRRTPRVEPMYKDGGHLYVFFVYGMHSCANVVTRPEGTPEAVLLRAAEGGQGVPAKLLSGPGRLCSAMGITVADTGKDLLCNGDIRLIRGPDACKEIGISRRIGVDYAGEAAGWPLRFFDPNSPAVSGPRRLAEG
jgi:DNA-3-methyladenine glycosylase